MSPNPHRFLALGDSYTIGEGVSAPESWPFQLAGRLRRENLPIADPVILAQTGWTTQDLHLALQGADFSEPFDLASLLIGLNDQYQGRETGAYGRGFRTLLRQAIRFAGREPGNVLVISIPDWGKTPFAQNRDQTRIRAEIEAFNALNRQESVQAGAHYVNITPDSHRVLDDRSLIAEDGLHPSGKMYACWVNRIFPLASGILQESVEH